MKVVILDAKTLGEDIDLSPVTQENETVVYEKTEPCLVAERIKDCQAVVVNKIVLNESNLCDAKNLKLICLAATGYDNVDIKYCKENGISVFNVVGYSSSSVCQVTVSMVLDLFNKMPQYYSYVKNGDYTKNNIANYLVPSYRELNGKTWGILGCGNIGSSVARVALAFGCRVLAYKNTPSREFENATLEEILRCSDIISIHLPYTEKTHNLIDEKAVSLMKDGVVVVNTARGKIVDETAILNGLEKGKIGGFGTDVYPVEPFGESSVYWTLKDKENVCMTPHMSWGAVESRNRCIKIIGENIKAFLSGKESKNRVI
jgi:glycerate dehydrogenase